MPNRDALWVLPNGVTTVVTVDEQGNRVDVPAPVQQPVEAPPPPAPKRGRKARR